MNWRKCNKFIERKRFKYEFVDITLPTLRYGSYIPMRYEYSKFRLLENCFWYNKE